MPKQPDMKFDVDALFAHLIGNLGHELEDEQEWNFLLRSDDFAKLKRIGESLAAEFEIRLQESVETHEDGRSYMGPPLLAIVMVAALGPDEVKALAARFADLARSEGLTYEGVSCYEPIDEEELFGWLDLESAVWRLRHFSDTGLESGASMPWVFAVTADDAAVVDSAAQAMRHAGHSRVEVEDTDVGPIVLIRFAGSTDEAELGARYREIERIATGVGAQLLGVQFFGEDDADVQE